MSCLLFYSSRFCLIYYNSFKCATVLVPQSDILNYCNSSLNVVIVYFQYGIFKWDEKTQGLILSGFYYGYAATQVPGGYLAEKFGGKWTLGIGLLSTALFTFLTPVVIRTGGAIWLFILRILQGMGEVFYITNTIYLLTLWHKIRCNTILFLFHHRIILSHFCVKWILFAHRTYLLIVKYPTWFWNQQLVDIEV